ncbi:hypothetical protein BFW01_g542 [Lasiodiplodia theobromae]|nr:hypothetical protein BFW01_g542 [Lasiodiplodia theobromae]
MSRTPSSSLEEKVDDKTVEDFIYEFEIRESDWENFSNQFNKDKFEDETYQPSLGQNGYSLVVKHQIPDTMKTSEPMLAAYEALGLVIAVFVNGHATKIAETEDEDGFLTYEIELDSEKIRKFDEGRESEVVRTLEITAAKAMAYKKKFPKSLQESSR